MVIYPDTSFLFSLYVQEETSVLATESIKGLAHSLTFTPFHRLELRTALRPRAFRAEIDRHDLFSPCAAARKTLRPDSSSTRRSTGRTPCAKPSASVRPISRKSARVPATCFTSPAPSSSAPATSSPSTSARTPSPAGPASRSSAGGGESKLFPQQRKSDESSYCDGKAGRAQRVTKPPSPPSLFRPARNGF